MDVPWLYIWQCPKSLHGSNLQSHQLLSLLVKESQTFSCLQCQLLSSIALNDSNWLIVWYLQRIPYYQLWHSALKHLVWFWIHTSLDLWTENKEIIASWVLCLVPLGRGGEFFFFWRGVGGIYCLMLSIVPLNRFVNFYILILQLTCFISVQLIQFCITTFHKLIFLVWYIHNSAATTVKLYVCS